MLLLPEVLTRQSKSGCHNKLTMDRLVHSDCGRVLMKVQYDSDPANLRALVTVDYGCNDIQLHPVVGSPHLFLVKSAPVGTSIHM